jgi:hypothetical protein
MKLLCNAIPKSGTYLLSEIAHYCGYKDEHVRFVEGGVNIVDDNNKLIRFEIDAKPDRLNRLSDGCYAPSHLAYSEDLSSFIKSNNFKHLLYTAIRPISYTAMFDL